MGFDDGTGDGKADAHADGVHLASGLAAVEEGRADLAYLFGGDAEAGILDGQKETLATDFTTAVTTAFTNAVTGDFDLGRNCDRAILAIVGDGILDDDEQDVTHLLEVDGQFRPRGVVSRIGNSDMLALDPAPKVSKDLFYGRF